MESLNPDLVCLFLLSSIVSSYADATGQEDKVGNVKDARVLQGQARFFFVETAMEVDTRDRQRGINESIKATAAGEGDSFSLYLSAPDARA